MTSRLLVVVLLAGCTDYLTPDPRETVGALPATVPEPADNPTTPAKVELGRLLYWDPILSGDRDIACATCHHPDFGYSDGLAVSVGTGGRGVGPEREANAAAPRTPRNAQTVLVTAWNGLSVDGATTAEQAPMFWDHRVTSLEAQALEPIKSAAEMRGTTFTEAQILDEVVSRLAGIPEYATRFQEVFGAEGVTATTLGKAIAAFERTLVPRDSSFDRYMAGDDDAMTAAQIRGLHGFIYQGCARCHSGPLFTDFQLHEIAIPSTPGAPIDLGDGQRRFRTPSLRMVTLTAPYMHDGSIESLGKVFDNYHNNIVTDPLLEGDVEVALGEADDLILFFDAISDGTFDRTIPPRVPSGLPPGGP